MAYRMEESMTHPDLFRKPQIPATQPHTLVRTSDPDTSVATACTVKVSESEDKNRL